ncbi:uncharacterized protein LOC107826308 [Nicotiana tabacum]|uniref:Uncharacterized protein LOC107826308 n=1 Tax=Nicotiana tabacum TaxID=4097 RepID=A0AC58T3I8_TOBAC
MPLYAKFLKKILSSKRKLEEVSAVKLTEKCSAILQNKLPHKLGGPGSFTIPCIVGGTHFEKALCDSGASIDLMPFSILRKLELGEMKDTGVSFQLADQRRAIIDVHQGQLILRVDEERVIFDMQKMIKFPGDESSSSCFQIDLLNDLVDEYKDNQLIIDSLERYFARSGTISDDNPIIREKTEMLEKESKNEKVSQEGVQLKIKLKDLSSHLKYVFLELESFPVIISSSLTIEHESKLIGVVRKHKRALEWTIADIKGIRLAICKHMILMENDYKPIVQPQRRLNPAMQEVIKKEMVKLAASIIYLISDSPWPQEKTIFLCPLLTKCLKEVQATVFTIFLIDILGIIRYQSRENHIHMPPRKAFEILKKELTNAPIVVSPDWRQPFEIMCDASVTVVGAILGQKRDKIIRPIYYASRTLNEAQKNYATTEKELLAVEFGFDKFRSYLIGTKVIIYTDHEALKFLLAKKDARPRLLRWILFL